MCLCFEIKLCKLIDTSKHFKCENLVESGEEGQMIKINAS